MTEEMIPASSSFIKYECRDCGTEYSRQLGELNYSGGCGVCGHNRFNVIAEIDNDFE